MLQAVYRWAVVPARTSKGACQWPCRPLHYYSTYYLRIAGSAGRASGRDAFDPSPRTRPERPGLARSTLDDLRFLWQYIESLHRPTLQVSLHLYSLWTRCPKRGSLCILAQGMTRPKAAAAAPGSGWLGAACSIRSPPPSATLQRMLRICFGNASY